MGSMTRTVKPAIQGSQACMTTVSTDRGKFAATRRGGVSAGRNAVPSLSAPREAPDRDARLLGQRSALVRPLVASALLVKSEAHAGAERDHLGVADEASALAVAPVRRVGFGPPAVVESHAGGHRVGTSCVPVDDGDQIGRASCR